MKMVRVDLLDDVHPKVIPKQIVIDLQEWQNYGYHMYFSNYIATDAQQQLSMICICKTCIYKTCTFTCLN